MTEFGGYYANYGHSYGGTPPPIVRPERFSPGTQILISVLLVLPTLPIFFANSLLLRADWVGYWPEPLRNLWALGCNAILPLYYLIVVACWARPTRRSAAVAIAFVTALLDTAWLAAILIIFRSSDTGLLAWVFAAVQVLIAVGYVVAWGVARRRTGIWAVGLTAAVVLGGIVQWVYRLLPTETFSDGSWWVKSWALNIGAFVLSCLICWALDVMGARSWRATTPLISDR
ncbi:hypothetical protein A5784_30095 [Mycobacterium sp. 852013-50091_SCH5140682]|uniref:hypothetical protein n=1 Tax=Mycobacterium sp. 852013-50091_SCH5140682 TaxID=1834109 RepID=UPI0007E9D37D|nr:hypothetical protein [Mycobacterium sp. 852013-50091_SCH5140682]OBC14232.1 hypothetical protein A5784_30095 [Mycobacterium sp. 852013-50091_SCH5140682]